MKTLGWIGSAKDDLLGLPADLVREVGHALYVAQMGGKHAAAKPLKGFGGASTLEITANQEGSTFRVVYTVRFPRIIYVLHAFQKKSRRGIATPAKELDRVKTRLLQAEQEYEVWQKENR